jgi:hypothetical protein
MYSLKLRRGGVMDYAKIKARLGAILKGPRAVGVNQFASWDDMIENVTAWATNARIGDATVPPPFYFVWLPGDLGTMDLPRTIAVTGSGPTSEAHAEFVAHAAEDMTLLLAEIERLTAERDALSDRVFSLECVIASARAALDCAHAEKAVPR